MNADHYAFQIPCDHCGAAVFPPTAGGLTGCQQCGATLSAFGHDLRVLLCRNCGALMNVELLGGATDCSYCGQSTVFPARNEVREYVDPGAANMSEPQRLAHLASQPAFNLPCGIGDAQLRDEWTGTDNAWRAWQQLRAYVGPDGSCVQQHDLFMITCYLHHRCRVHDQQLRQRALLESTVELLSEPRLRQLTRCMLVRNAARLGDVRAAREWLEPCNPRPLDRHMDSAYRAACSAIEIAVGNFDKVIELLGAERGPIPISHAYRDLVALYRAHAIELSGDHPRATEQLAKALSGFSRSSKQVRRAGYFSNLIVMFLLHQDIGLCARSFPEAYCHVFGGRLVDYTSWDRTTGRIELRPPPAAQRLRMIVLGLLLLLPLLAILAMLAITVATW